MQGTARWIRTNKARHIKKEIVLYIELSNLNPNASYSGFDNEKSKFYIIDPNITNLSNGIDPNGFDSSFDPVIKVVV